MENYNFLVSIAIIVLTTKVLGDITNKFKGKYYINFIGNYSVNTDIICCIHNKQKRV